MYVVMQRKTIRDKNINLSVLLLSLRLGERMQICVQVLLGFKVSMSEGQKSSVRREERKHCTHKAHDYEIIRII